MRKLILLFAAVALIFTACEKDKQNEVAQPETQNEATVEFNIKQTGFDFKNLVPECSELLPNYVKFVIQDATGATQDYKTSIIKINEESLTQVLKLNPGTYLLTNFLVYNDNGTPEDEADDVLIQAAPEIDSEYWDLMEFPLNREFTVVAFMKNEVDIDVLCYEELFFEEFGFTWFNFHDVRIERTCFFGDICTGKLQDFEDTDDEESPYADQPEGIQMDMPAIFEVLVYKNDGDSRELLRTFSNRAWLGVGQCLEVYWPNRIEEVGEQFTMELWVLLPTGPGFEYNLINSWNFIDGVGPNTGDDGVVDFVMGNCVYGDEMNTDYILPYWMDLPTDEFNMRTHLPSEPGLLGTFMDVTFTDIPPGHDIRDSTYGIWCGNYFIGITGERDYTVKAYSSLAPLTWPLGMDMDPDKIAKVNFFFNKLPELLPNFEYDNYLAHWAHIQRTIWALTDGVFSPNGNYDDYDYVMANYQGYEIPPGGWAAILFWGDENVQLVFIEVDP